MSSNKERILVVESDPVVSDLVARQALGNQGFDIKVVSEARAAIHQAKAFSPDVVIASLELPGLSGKDLIVALSSQNIHVPVIMIASKGQEKDIIQAFRLGASDYIGSPIREAEVVSAVERALKTTRARSERERLSRQVQRTNKELERRVDELTTIFAVGKAVTSITDQKELFDRVIEGAVKITQADYGWLLIKDERTNEFILRAQLNLPKSLAVSMDEPWDDGISILVARSGEPFSIHGEPIDQFMISSLGKSALITPVKLKQRIIALLVVMRKSAREFNASDQTMLEAVSDYAAISLVNSRLFKALDERAAKLQTAVEKSRETEQLKDEIVQNVSHELRTPLVAAKGYVDMIVGGEMGKFSTEQKEALDVTQQKLEKMVEIVEAMNTMHESASPKDLTTQNLNELAGQAVDRFSMHAQQAGVKLITNLPSDALFVQCDAPQIGLVFDSLLSNALKFSPEGGVVTLRIRRTQEDHAQVSVADQGIGISKKNQKKIFSRFFQIDGSTTRNYGGLGIGLALVKEIVEGHGGKVWVESKLDQGSTFHFTLLPPE